MDERGSILGRWRGFFLHNRVQTGSGVHSATGGSFPGGKADGAWSWQLTPI